MKQRKIYSKKVEKMLIVIIFEAGRFMPDFILLSNF